MKRSALLLVMAIVFFGLWGGGSPAMAEQGCGYPTRSMLRYQEGMLEDERDQHIDALRAIVEQQEDQLRCWYKAERAALDAEYDRVRRCVDRCTRRQLARDHDDREDALRRCYREQRVALRRGRVVAELQTRDQYRQMERSLKYGVVPVHFTGVTEAIVTPSPVLSPAVEPIPVPPPVLGPALAPEVAPR